MAPGAARGLSKPPLCGNPDASRDALGRLGRTNEGAWVDRPMTQPGPGPTLGYVTRPGRSRPDRLGDRIRWRRRPDRDLKRRRRRRARPLSQPAPVAASRSSAASQRRSARRRAGCGAGCQDSGPEPARRRRQDRGRAREVSSPSVGAQAAVGRPRRPDRGSQGPSDSKSRAPADGTPGSGPILCGRPSWTDTRTVRNLLEVHPAAVVMAGAGTGQLLLLRDVRDQRLRGQDHSSDRGGVLERRASHLGGVHDPFLKRSPYSPASAS